ncbi:MAG TPA: carboxypeptidase-like regulatory domain-containing protein, partial [Cyclobacteriaceae bacterium]
MQKVLALLFLINISASALAQNGSITGVVTDASTGEALIGANVVIAGTQTGAPTDVEGKFVLNNMKPGSYTLLVTFVTYKTDTLSSVIVEAGKTTIIKSSLREEAKELQEVVVKGQADRTSETTLLSDRKNSVVMIQ